MSEHEHAIAEQPCVTSVSELVERFRQTLLDPQSQLLTRVPLSSTNWGTEAKAGIAEALAERLPAPQAGEDTELVQRLRSAVEGTSRASRMLAAAKSARNEAAGDAGADYEGLTPEQTLEWRAAACIERLSSELDAVHELAAGLAHEKARAACTAAGWEAGREAADLLPREPNEAMLNAGWHTQQEHENTPTPKENLYIVLWKAMWDAAVKGE